MNGEGGEELLGYSEKFWGVFIGGGVAMTWLDNLAWDPPISRRQCWNGLGKQSNKRPRPSFAKGYIARWLSGEPAPLGGISHFLCLAARVLARPAGCSLFEIKMTPGSGSESVEVAAVSHGLIAGLVFLHWEMVAALILDNDRLCALLR
jgi:hypothetical protein